MGLLPNCSTTHNAIFGESNKSMQTPWCFHQCNLAPLHLSSLRFCISSCTSRRAMKSKQPERFRRTKLVAELGRDSAASCAASRRSRFSQKRATSWRKALRVGCDRAHDLSNSIISYNALQWNDGSSASHQGLLMSWQETQARLNPRWSQSHPTCGFSGPFPSSRSNSSATDRELLSDGLEAVFETSSGWERHWAIFSRRRSCGCGLLHIAPGCLQKEVERFDLSRATLIFGVSQSAGWLCDIPWVPTLSMKTPDASNRLDFHYQFIPNTRARYISPSHQPILAHHFSSDSKHKIIVKTQRLIMFDSENAYSLTNSQPFRSAPAEFPPSASADAAAGATRFGSRRSQRRRWGARDAWASAVEAGHQSPGNGLRTPFLCINHISFS